MFASPPDALDDAVQALLGHWHAIAFAALLLNDDRCVMDTLGCWETTTTSENITNRPTTSLFVAAIKVKGNEEEKERRERGREREG